jgi:hypothetical protein
MAANFTTSGKRIIGFCDSLRRKHLSGHTRFTCKSFDLSFDLRHSPARVAPDAQLPDPIRFAPQKTSASKASNGKGECMSYLRINRFVISAVLMLTPSAFASTLYVGTCHTPSYNTISEAVDAAPAGATIKVCPGTYPEQIVLTQAVTLEGISSDNLEQAIVVSPPNGMVVNAWDDMGDAIAAQLYVDPISGFFISDITFDASNNEVQGDYVVGIFVQNSPGTINHVVTRNQIAGGYGVGIWVEGGASDPKVTVENSSIHDFDDIGIWTQTNAAAPEVTATISGNFVNGETAGGTVAASDIQLEIGTTATVSNNYLFQGNTGITGIGQDSGEWAWGMTKNNLIDNGTAVALGGGGNSEGNVSITNNNIFYSSVEGISLNAGLLLPAVQKNTIVDCPIAIELNGNGDTNLYSNTITDSGIGLDQAPAGFSSSNTYYNVGTLMTTPGGDAAKHRVKF